MTTLSQAERELYDELRDGNTHVFTVDKEKGPCIALSAGAATALHEHLRSMRSRPPNSREWGTLLSQRDLHLIERALRDIERNGNDLVYRDRAQRLGMSQEMWQMIFILESVKMDIPT